MNLDKYSTTGIPISYLAAWVSSEFKTCILQTIVVPWYLGGGQTNWVSVESRNLWSCTALGRNLPNTKSEVNVSRYLWNMLKVFYVIDCGQEMSPRFRGIWLYSWYLIYIANPDDLKLFIIFLHCLLKWSIMSWKWSSIKICVQESRISHTE